MEPNQSGQDKPGLGGPAAANDPALRPVESVISDINTRPAIGSVIEPQVVTDAVPAVASAPQQPTALPQSPQPVVASEPEPAMPSAEGQDVNALSTDSPLVQQPTQAPQSALSPQPVSNPSPVKPPESEASQPARVAQSPSGGKSKKKSILTALAVAAVLAIGVASFVFGYYLPNTPENVWKTGLQRTADELDALAGKLGDANILESFNKNQLTVKGRFESEGSRVNVDLESKYDQESSDSSLQFEASGDGIDQGYSLDIDVKTQKIDESIWPNIYFKLSGIKELGFDSFMPKINEFDGKWIAVEQDFYEEMSDGLNADQDDESTSWSDISQEDIASVVKDFSEVSREYLFSTEPDRAVLKVKEFIGTEESEGLEANRYKVEIDLENGDKYCRALIDKLLDNEVVRRVGDVEDDEIDSKKETGKESCNESEKDDDNETTDTTLSQEFDVWVDREYKLLHKVRVYEDLESRNAVYRKDKAECEERFASYDFEGENGFCDYYDDRIETGERYYEFGQIYRGASDVRLFSTVKSDTSVQKYTGRLDLNVNINTLAFNGQINMDSTHEDAKFNMTIEIATEPYDGEIDASKPEGAVPLLEVYEYLMQSPAQPPEGESLGARTDQEIQWPFRLF